MLMKKVFGVIPPMVTAFKSDGTLDEEGTRRIVTFLCNHIHGLFVCGSYGCGPLMSAEERKKVAEIVSKSIQPDKQLIVHVGSTNVSESLDLAKHAEGIGAIKVAAVAPYYYHHNKDNIKRYYESLVNAVKIPVYVYHNPRASGYRIEIDLLEELADLGIAGIKDSSFDIMYLGDCLRKFKKTDFDVVLGTEAMFLSGAALGIQAYIPGLGNAWPELCVKLFESGFENRFIEGREIQSKVNDIRDIMYLAKSTIVAVYAMLELRGICKVYPRAPFLPLPEKEKELLRKELENLEVL
jgi:dihydrodipicolinate synthase/N-acetylneuraminate lyase